MHSHAFIVQVNDDEILAMQLITQACVTCTTGCLQRGKPFAVANSRHFPVGTGTVVRIGRSRFTRAVHGLVSLIVPVASAVAGYLLSGLIAKKIGFESTETFKAVCVMSFLAMAAGIVFVVSRSRLHFLKPEILQVL